MHPLLPLTPKNNKEKASLAHKRLAPQVAVVHGTELPPPDPRASSLRPIGSVPPQLPHAGGWRICIGVAPRCRWRPDLRRKIPLASMAVVSAPRAIRWRGGQRGGWRSPSCAVTARLERRRAPAQAMPPSPRPTTSHHRSARGMSALDRARKRFISSPSTVATHARGRTCVGSRTSHLWWRALCLTLMRPCRPWQEVWRNGFERERLRRDKETRLISKRWVTNVIGRNTCQSLWDLMVQSQKLMK